MRLNPSELNETQHQILIRICFFVVIVYNVVMSIWLLANSVLTHSKRNHLLWNLAVRGKNPTLIASPPKTMGWFGLVQISNLSLLANVLKMIQRKMLVSFFETWKQCCVQIDFFLRDSLSYMWFQLKKILFLGYEHFLSVGWIKKCPFCNISSTHHGLSHLPASCLFF